MAFIGTSVARQKYRGDVPQKFESVTVQGTPKDPPSVNLPTSQEGIIVPWMIGRNRAMSPNIIAYGNLQPVIETTYRTKTETTQEVNPKYIEPNLGRPPLQSPTIDVVKETVEKTDTIVAYKVDAQMGLCLGEGVRLRAVYENNAVIWEGNSAGGVINLNSDFMGTSIVFYGGTLTQAPEIIAGLTDIPAYAGISYIRLNGMHITGSRGQISFELERHPNPLGLTAAQNVNADGDVNIATALYCAITEAWGAGGVPIAQINAGSFKAAGEQLALEGNYCSLWQSTENMLSNVIKILEVQSDGTVTQNTTTGLVEFNLTRIDSYDPAVAKHFDESTITNIVSRAKDATGILANFGRATYSDRSANYATGVVMAETVSVSTRGGKVRKPVNFEYPASMTAALTRKLLSRDLARAASPAFTCQIELTRAASDVAVGEIISVSNERLKLNKFPMRVDRVRDTNLKLNKIILLCSQLTSISGRAIFSPPEETLFVDLDPTPKLPLHLTIKDAPFFLAYITSSRIGKAMPIIFAERANAMQTGFATWLVNEPDNPNPVMMRDASPYSTYGKLQTAIGLRDGYLDGKLTTIRISGVNDPSNLRTCTVDEQKAGISMVFIDDEIFTYTSFTRVSAGVYDLTGINRALIDTNFQQHAVNADVWICSGYTSVPSRPQGTGIQVGVPNNRLSTVCLPYVFNAPSPYSPAFVVNSNTMNRAGKLESGANVIGWVPSGRLNSACRVQDTKIGGARVVTAAGVSVARSAKVVVFWKNRATWLSNSFPFMSDPSQDTSSALGHQCRVWLTPSTGAPINLGTTAPYLDWTGTPAANSIEVTIPAGAALGIGTIHVETLISSFNSSRYNEFMPVTITA